MESQTQQKTSTLKPFAKGDIFLGCTYLNDPKDDHKGEGRILQFDKNWVAKGTWYTTGTRYFIVGCTVGPDGTLWGFDGHDHIAVRATPDAKELPPWDSGRSFGSVNWDRDGNHYFGEYFIGKEIWKGTTAKLLADGTLGAGHIYKYSPDLQLMQDFPAENAPEPTRFKGVTHSTLHPSGEFLAYTTETARRLMRYGVRGRGVSYLIWRATRTRIPTTALTSAGLLPWLICPTDACCAPWRTGWRSMTRLARSCNTFLCQATAGLR